MADAQLDPRPPKPHITLARPTRKISTTERIDAVRWAKQLDLGAPTITLDRLALYTWADSRTHRLFKIVRERPLGG